jgi:hypothetical protein
MPGRNRLSADLSSLQSQLASRFPTLRLVTGDGRVVIRGMLLIEHEGRELDRFAVEIDLSQAGPATLPVVREVAGRIPRHVDRHVNADGSACVCLPEDYFSRNPGKLDAIAFVEGPVRDFFIGQALVERGDPWPHGEWGHGPAGLTEWLQAFSRSLTDDQRRAYASTFLIRKLRGHVPCPCGGGRKLRDCHMDLLMRLRAALPPERALQLLAPGATGET